MRAEIEIGGTGHGRVLLDGTNVSDGVRALSIRSAVGELTTVELDLAVIDGVLFASEVQVVIPDATREALVALGWTPPED